MQVEDSISNSNANADRKASLLAPGTDRERERDVRERKKVINWTENEWRYDHHERILILSKAATLNGVECREEGGGLLMSDFLAFP